MAFAQGPGLSLNDVKFKKVFWMFCNLLYIKKIIKCLSLSPTYDSFKANTRANVTSFFERAQKVRIYLKLAISRCQFHQHSTYKFFVPMSILAAFSSYMYVEKAAKADIRTKKLYVECWWNWLQLSFQTSSWIANFVPKHESVIYLPSNLQYLIKLWNKQYYVIYYLFENYLTMFLLK